MLKGGSKNLSFPSPRRICDTFGFKTHIDLGSSLSHSGPIPEDAIQEGGEMSLTFTTRRVSKQFETKHPLVDTSHQS
jgi:hypothetical protein